MKICSSILAGLIIASGFQVAGASAQTLKEALASAYVNNTTLTAARASLRATDEQVPQALAGWRPTVTMSGDYGREFTTNSVSTTPRLHLRPGDVSLTVTQPLYQGGQTSASVHKAENTVEAARARLTSTEQSVLLDTVTAYMNVVQDQAVLELNINNEQVLRRQLQATQDQYQVGEVTLTDVHQAEARLAGATAGRVQAEGNLQVARATYRNVVGEFPGKLVAPAVPTNIPVDSKGVVSLALADNPDVKAAVYDERAALNDEARVRGQLLPTVSLSGSASKSYDSISPYSRVTDLQALVSVSVPLYQAGSVYSQLRAARQTVVQDQQLLETARRNAVETATQQWQNLETARAALDSYRSQVAANRIALDGVRREAEVGSRTVLDILNAEQELLNSQVNLVGAQRDQIVAIYGIKSAIGVLTAKGLSLPVKYYNPDTHYREVRDKWFGGVSGGDATPSK